MLVGAMLVIIDQGKMYWDTRESVQFAKTATVQALSEAKDGQEEIKRALAGVFDRQMNIEGKLASVEVTAQRRDAETAELIEKFRREQARLRNTIAPRQPNPKLQSAASAYDAEKVRAELEAIKKRIKRTVRGKRSK